MKTVLHTILAAAAALLLSACATSGGLASATGPAAYPHGERILTDADYVARVERAARDRGVVVQWVNPPTRRDRLLGAR